MSESPSALLTWLDRDFWQQGAVLSFHDDGKVVFAKGGTVSSTESFVSSSNPVFYLKDFFSNQYLAYHPANYIILEMNQVVTFMKGFRDNHTPLKAVRNFDDFYAEDFATLKGSFSDKLKKVVLISRESYGPFEGECSIRRLLKKAFELGTGQPYGFWTNDYGVIGSTPELLYSVKANALKTFALAGTARAGQEQELLNSKKDRFEHELVITDIKEKLQPFADETSIGETFTIPFRNLVHLKTPISATVSDETDLQALTSQLSPTAALGGYPMKEAKEFLKKTQYFRKFPNRYFGSCFGIVSQDWTEFVVSIRNVQWSGEELFIESGGGVVPYSVLQKELDEIHWKRKVIREHYL